MFRRSRLIHPASEAPQRRVHGRPAPGCRPARAGLSTSARLTELSARDTSVNRVFLRRWLWVVGPILVPGKPYQLHWSRGSPPITSGPDSAPGGMLVKRRRVRPRAPQACQVVPLSWLRRRLIPRHRRNRQMQRVWALAVLSAATGVSLRRPVLLANGGIPPALPPIPNMKPGPTGPDPFRRLVQLRLLPPATAPPAGSCPLPPLVLSRGPTRVSLYLPHALIG